MTTKEELSQYKYKAARVQEALEEYENYLTRATKMTAIMSQCASHTNSIGDKVGANAAAMADLDKEYQNRWIEAERERIKLVDKINAVDEPYRKLLIERYIHEKTFEQIAVEMAYSYDSAVHLHR